MEILNYFKINCLLQTLIREQLIDNFKIMWLNESGTEWISNPAHGVFLKKLNSNFDNYFNTEEKELIENGKLLKFNLNILSSCLLHLEPNKNKTKKLLSKQNKFINKIREINNNNFKLTNENYENLKESLLNCLIKISKDDASLVKERVELILNGGGDVSNSNIDFKSNVENDAKLLKEKGNEQFKNGDYFRSMETYRNALSIDGLSNKTISILNLNNSTAGVNYFEELSQRLDFNLLFKDYLFLMNSKEAAIKSIINLPYWAKPYIKLSQIFSRISNYDLSIQLLDTANYLLSSTTSTVDKKLLPPSPSIDEILKLKNQNQDKLNLKNKCYNVIFKPSTGETIKTRDFNKEGRALIKQYGNLIASHFNGKNITLDYIKKQNWFSKTMEKEFKSFSKTTGLPIENFYEYFLFRQLENSNIMEYLSRIIGNRSKIANAYSQYAQLNSNSFGGIERNDKLIISLYLYASTLPVSFKLKSKITKINNAIEFNNNIADNYGSVSSQDILGLIYRYGRFGQDIDLEKSIYYFELSTKNDLINNDQTRYNCRGFSYSCLGLMYYFGITPNGIKNKEKAKEIWLKGVSLKDEYSKRYLYQYFEINNIKHLIEKQEIIQQTLNEKSLFTCEPIDYNHSSLFFYNEGEEFQQFLDFNEIKKLHLQSKQVCELYISSIYLDHLNVLQFLKKFQQYQDDLKNGIKVSIDEKIYLINHLLGLYSKLETFFVVKFPTTKINAIKEFIDEMLKLLPNDNGVRIVWIGFHRFYGIELIDNDVNSIGDSSSFHGVKSSSDFKNLKNEKFLKFIQDSIDLENQIDSEKQEHRIILYCYKAIFLELLANDNLLDHCFGTLTNPELNIFKHPDNIESVIFLYYLTCKACSYYETVPFENIDILLDSLSIFIKVLKERNHPYVAEIYLHLTTTLINYNKLNQVEHYSKLKIKSLYDQGIKSINLIPKILIFKLKQLNNFKDSVFNLLNQLYPNL